MLSKVKKDLTTYLDRLEKKVAVSRDLKDKAVDAVEKGKAEEDLDEFAPVGGDDREPDEEEILRQLAAQWWRGDADPKAERTLAAMGWEIGQDESGDDDAGVFLVRAGDVNGNSYMALPQSELEGLAEEIDTDPAAMQGPSDPGDTEVAHNIELGIADKLNAPQSPQAPSATFESIPDVEIPSKNEEDEVTAIRRLALGKKELDELDYSAASGATAQPSVNQQAQTAGSAIKKYMPAATKFAANTVRQMKGQDPTKDPSYAKLSPAQQQQYVQAQKTIDATDADELEKFDANQAAANVQGMAKSVVNPANMPDVNLKSNVVDRKTAADYAPATVSGKPATPPTSATTPDTPAATFEMADGKSLSCYGNDNEGYELRHGEQALPSKFKNLDHAGMAVKLYQARKKRQQRPEQDPSQDYIEER
jgi:hypothetical protein